MDLRTIFNLFKMLKPTLNPTFSTTILCFDFYAFCFTIKESSIFIENRFICSILNFSRNKSPNFVQNVFLEYVIYYGFCFPKLSPPDVIKYLK